MDNVSHSETSASGQGYGPTGAQQPKGGAENVKKQAANLKDEAAEQAAASFEDAKANLKEAAQKATGYGQGLIQEQQSRLAQIIDEYCRSAQAASEKLHQEGHSALANRAGEVVSRFHRVSRYLHERKPAEVYRDAEGFTRRRPDVVFGLMFAAGLFTARVLKASDRRLASDRTANSEGEQRPSEGSTIKLQAEEAR